MGELLWDWPSGVPSCHCPQGKDLLGPLPSSPLWSRSQRWRSCRGSPGMGQQGQGMGMGTSPVQPSASQGGSFWPPVGRWVRDGVRGAAPSHPLLLQLSQLLDFSSSVPCFV